MRRLPARRRLIGAAAAIALLVGIVFVLRPRGGAQQVRAADTATTTTSSSTTTTSATTTTTVVEETTTTVAVPVTTAAVAPTPATLDPNVNQPMRMTIRANRTELAPGDAVTVTVTLTDPDATSRGHCVVWTVDIGTGPQFMRQGDGAENCFADPGSEECSAPPGGADPGNTTTDSFTTSYDDWQGWSTPLDMVVRATAFSSDAGCVHGSSAEKAVTISVPS